MAEGAALLVDTLLPPVRYRQWVLSFAGPMSVRLGYDAPRLARVSRCFARRVMQSVRERVKRHHELPSVSPLAAGVVTVVQRFRSDLALYVHLHSLATDGAFLDVDGRSVRWLAAPPPSDADLHRVLARLHRDLATGDDPNDEGEGDTIDPALAGCLSLSLGGPPPLATAIAPPVPQPLTATAFGMSLHAATAVDGRDRPRLERLCRYLLRPPFAHDAVERLAGGRVRVHFKRPTRAGVTHADMRASTASSPAFAPSSQRSRGHRRRGPARTQRRGARIISARSRRSSDDSGRNRGSLSTLASVMARLICSTNASPQVARLAHHSRLRRIDLR